MLVLAIVIRMAHDISQEFSEEERKEDSTVEDIGGHSIVEILCFLFAILIVFTLCFVLMLLILFVVLRAPQYGNLDVGLGTLCFASVFYWRLCIYEPISCQCEDCLADWFDGR